MAKGLDLGFAASCACAMIGMRIRMSKLTFRWIAEYQRDQGGTNSAAATIGKAVRGERGFFDGAFGNFNFGYTKLLKNAANDLRFSAGFVNANRGNDDAVVPEVTITGITAPFGDIFNNRTKLRTYEIRDTFSLVKGNHTIRFGGEGRRICLHANRGTLSAADADETDAGQLRNFLGEPRVCQLFDLRQRKSFRSECQSENRRVGGICLAVDGRDRQIFRQITCRRIDRRLYLLLCDVDIEFQCELKRDNR